MSDTGSALLKTVVAERTDGLGIRLLAILQAMHLADLLGAKFAFTWSDKSDRAHHATPSAAETFREEYLAQYVVKPRQAGIVENTEPVNEIEDLQRMAEGAKGWRLRETKSFKWLPGVTRFAPPGRYRKHFNSIGFRRYIKDAINAAREAELAADAVALHLRAGDIVYGEYRFELRFARKVVALPIALALVERWTAQGRTVVLFNQDPDVAPLFRAFSNVVVAEDLAKRFEKPIARALFEIVLMSRCAEIYAGSSGFANLAARIGDVTLTEPRRMLKPQEQIGILETDLSDPDRMARYPDMQAAFAAWHGAILLEPSSPERALPLYRLAAEKDPVNGYYRLKCASILYRMGRRDEADGQLRSLFDDGAETARAVALRSLAQERGNGFVMAADHQIYAAAAQRGSAYAQRLVEHVARAEA